MVAMWCVFMPALPLVHVFEYKLPTGSTQLTHDTGHLVWCNGYSTTRYNPIPAPSLPNPRHVISDAARASLDYTRNVFAPLGSLSLKIPGLQFASIPGADDPQFAPRAIEPTTKSSPTTLADVELYCCTELTAARARVRMAMNLILGSKFREQSC